MLHVFVGVHARGGDPPCRWQAQANAGLRMTALGNVICVCWPVRPRGEILPAFGVRKRTPCGVQDDTRRTGGITHVGLGKKTLKNMNRPPPFVIHHATQQQARINPPNAVIQSRPHTDGPREESPYGRKCCRDTAPAFGVHCRLRGEILPAVGRRKRRRGSG